MNPDHDHDHAHDHDATRPAGTDKWRPLRVWIPILLVPAMGFMRFVPGLVPNGPSMIWMTSAFGPFLIGLLVMVWWLAASRARWFERLLGVAGLVGAIVVERNKAAVGPSLAFTPVYRGMQATAARGRQPAVSSPRGRRRPRQFSGQTAWPGSRPRPCPG